MAIFFTSSTSARGVLMPAMTSTSFMTGAGLKKCMPMRGRSSCAPSSVMDREEVLEAKMQSGFTMVMSSVKVAFFTSMFSKAASTMRSQSEQMSFVPVVMRPRMALAAFSSILPFATRFMS